jgi:signal peptidase I
LAETTTPEVLSYSIAPSRRGYGFVAIGGTCLFPGVGHLIVGSFRRGIIWLTLDLLVQILSLAMICNSRLFLYGLCLSIVSIILPVIIGIDAYFSGRRSTRLIYPETWERYALGVALIFVGVVRVYLENFAINPLKHSHIRAFVMSTKPMVPTIAPGNFIAVAVGAQVNRWDIIAYHAPSVSQSIKITSMTRVVGLPGETVELTRQGLLINGQLIQPPPNIGPYVQPRFGPRNGCEGNPIHLGPDEYFVLGDNTAISKDSCYWDDPPTNRQSGAVPADYIVGVAKAVCWPPNQFKILPQ